MHHTVETKSRLLFIKYSVPTLKIELNKFVHRKFTENFTEKLYWKGTPAYALFVDRQQTATSEISSKNQNSSTG